MPKPTNSRRSESFKEVVQWDLFKMMPTNLLTLRNSRTSRSITVSHSVPNLEAFQKWLTEKKVFEEKVENHHGFDPVRPLACTPAPWLCIKLWVHRWRFWAECFMARRARPLSRRPGRFRLCFVMFPWGFPQVVGWMQAEEKKFLLPKVKADGLFSVLVGIAADSDCSHESVHGRFIDLRQACCQQLHIKIYRNVSSIRQQQVYQVLIVLHIPTIISGGGAHCGEGNIRLLIAALLTAKLAVGLFV